MIRKILVGFVVLLLLLVGCIRGAENAQATGNVDVRDSVVFAPNLHPPTFPPDIERCEPTRFSATDKTIDMQQWLQKTSVDKQKIWFDTSPQGWRIAWDNERRKVVRIIIHHTGENVANQTAKAISDYQLGSLYQTRYNSQNDDPYVVGLPISSGHFIKKSGDQAEHETFIGYHHLIDEAGMVSNELQSMVMINGQWYVSMVTWNCGKWEVNCEAISICLIGNFDLQPPSDAQIDALKKLIAVYQEQIDRANKTLGLPLYKLAIEPHLKYKNTHCPGLTWPQWKQSIGAE